MRLSELPARSRCPQRQKEEIRGNCRRILSEKEILDTNLTEAPAKCLSHVINHKFFANWLVCILHF